MKAKVFLPTLPNLRGLALAAIALASHSACAHPYASGISNNAGTISFILNESADSVQIAFDDRTSTNNLGGLSAGVQTFALGAHTNYAIIVSKAGVGAPSQISADTNRFLNFYYPRGVAVNRNPKTANFGRIYVAHSTTNTEAIIGGGSRPMGQGVYLLNADQSDAVGQGDVALTAGMPLDTAVTALYAPYKISVGPDDQVYVGDGRGRYVGGTGAGVWMAAPDFSSGQDLLPLGNTNVFGGVVGTPIASGSIAAGDLVLYALEWDTAPYQTVWRYNIGAGPLPHAIAPTAVCNAGISTVNGVFADMAVGPDGKIYTMEYRATPGATSIPLRVFDASGNVLWDSWNNTTGNDPYAYAYGIAISSDGKLMATMNSSLGQFATTQLTNGIPDPSTFTIFGDGLVASSRGIAFDAADNVYITSSGSGVVRVYSLGEATTCVTSNDWTCTNGTFSITKSTSASQSSIAGPQDAHLDLQGTVVLAEYDGGNYGTLSIGGVPFVQNNARLLGNASATMQNLPNFGTGQDAANLALISQSIVWSSRLDFTVPCVAGHSYKLQLLFHDNYWASSGSRRFNVTVGGQTVDWDIDLALLGANLSKAKDVVVSYSFTNTDGNPLEIVLSAVKDNAILNGLILQDTSGLAVAPVITAAPASQTVYSGNKVVFQSAALGSLPLAYQWQAGAIGSGNYTNLYGSRFSGTNSATLTIANAKLSDQLDYVVRVSNSAGAAASSPAATLTVQPLGNVALVTAPTAAVLGLTNGTVVIAEYYGTDNGLMTIAGNVFRNNNARLGQSATTTMMQYIPNFGTSQDATNLALISTSDVWNNGFDFTVPTVAGRSYVLRLLFHDNYLSTVGDRVFQVSAGLQSAGLQPVGPLLDLVQLGAYQAQPVDVMLTLNVANSDGSPLEVQLNAAANAPMISALTLQDVSSLPVPPMVTIDPASQTLYSGHTAMLSAVVAGTSLFCQWEAGAPGTGVFTNLTNSGNISGSETPVLTLANVNVDSAADYRLVVTNQAGTAISAVANVNVQIGPPLIVTDLPYAQTIRAGRTVSLAAMVDGSAPFAFQWLYNGGSLADGGRISGAHSNVLTIANAQTSDAGSYQLSILNDQSGGYPTLTIVDAVTIVNGAATFNADGTDWTLNGGASIAGDALALTDGGLSETRSAFYNAQLYVGSFQAGFTYQDVGSGAADGAAFVLQNATGPTFLGASGSGLGYAGVSGPSVALMMNIYSANPAGGRGIYLATDGIGPIPFTSPYLNTAPVSLVSGNPIDVKLIYANYQLNVTLTDSIANTSFNATYVVNLPASLGADTAYVGMTGADGGVASSQQITNFYFKPVPVLSAQLTSTNTVLLTWAVDSGGFVVQSNTNLASGTWQTVPGFVGVVPGHAIVPASAGNQFYRLALP